MGNITKKFIFNDIVFSLFTGLNDREKEVITKRHSLNGADKVTLEQIGRTYNITRERVRQIENDALKKVIKSGLESSIIDLEDLNKIANEFATKHGGFIAHNHLMDLLLHTQDIKEVKALEFLLNNIVSANFSILKHPTLDVVFKQNDIKDEIILSISKAIHDHIESIKQPITFDELLEEIAKLSEYKDIENLKADNHDVVQAILKAHKSLGTNILGQWGQEHWTTIKPKRMTDKAYLVMLREQRPLHFEECAELINQANFDKKKACAATVHNELILDDKYVLVGRGLYALKDWGFEDGTVSDIIAKILKDNGPLTKKELSDLVLKQRLVQKTTITLALMNKDKFQKQEDGTYKLV